MFEDTKFNGNISKLDVSNVENMSCIFMFSKFNQDISDWNIENLTYFYGMFEYSKFKKDLSKWVEQGKWIDHGFELKTAGFKNLSFGEKIKDVSKKSIHNLGAMFNKPKEDKNKKDVASDEKIQNELNNMANNEMGM